MRSLREMDVFDKGLLYEYGMNISGVTTRLRPDYCRLVEWKDVGWYLTWIVFRYCLGCATYEEALPFATADTMETYCLTKFYERRGRMYIGLGRDVLGEDAEEVFEVELSSNSTPEIQVWALKVALDILYHDVPPAKQIAVALAHPHPSGDPLQRRPKQLQAVQQRLTERKNLLYRKLTGTLLAFLFALSLLLSPCKADGIQYDPAGNVVPEGGMNSYQGVRVDTKEEALALEDRLIADGYVLFRKDRISERDWALLMMPDVHLLFQDWLEEDSYPPDRCHIYVYGKTYKSALSQLETQPYLEWYTELEFAVSTVLVNYLPFDARELVGTQSEIFNEKVKDTVAAWLLIRSPVNAEVRLKQVSTLQYYLFYVAADEPFLIRLPYGQYEVSVINAVLIYKDDGYFNLSPDATEQSPKELSLQALCEGYSVPAGDIAGKPNYSATAKNTFYGDEYRVELPDEGENKTSEPDSKQPPPFVWWLIGCGAAALLLISVFAIRYIKKVRRGGVV